MTLNIIHNVNTMMLIIRYGRQNKYSLLYYTMWLVCYCRHSLPIWLNAQLKIMNLNFEPQLRAELEDLKRITGLGSGLSLIWAPDSLNPLSGEVKSSTMYIYDIIERKALDTLHHEFLDYCVSEAIQPYREVANILMKLLNEYAYKRKEEIVEGLRKLAFIE